MRALAALLLAALALPAAAQNKREPLPRGHVSEKGEARIVVDDAWPPVGPGIVFPVRVELENQADEKRTFDVVWQGRGTQSDRVSRRLELGPGERVRFSLLIPRAGTAFRSDLSVAIEDVADSALADEGDWSYLDTQARASPGRLRGRGVLVVDDGKPALTDLQAHDPEAYANLIALTPERLSEKWQAYDGLRAIFVRARVWSTLSPDHVRAIETAVRAGGLLVLYGERGEDTPKVGALGLGEVREIRDPFGAAGLAWLGDSGPWFGETLVPDSFRVPGVEAVPLVALKIILLVFVLLVGPANLFFTWYVLKNRPLLLVTTPLLAAAGSILLFTWSFLSEGFGIKSSTVSWTWLDPDSNTAVVRQESVLYAGLSPSGGIVFDPDTALWTGSLEDVRGQARDPWTVPTSRTRYGYGYGYSPPRRRDDEPDAGAYEIDWSESLAVRSGGLPARRMNWMSSGRILEVRTRIALESDGAGELVLVNGLGVPIESAWVRGPGGSVRRATGSIEPGGKATLVRTSTVDFGTAKAPAWLEKQLAEPGSYVLFLESNPWLELGVEDPDAREDLHFVTGRATLP